MTRREHTSRYETRQNTGTAPLTPDEREALVSAWAEIFRAELRALSVGSPGGSDRKSESEAA